MLSDVFVPVLTYPEPTSKAALDRLPDFLHPFAKSVHLCAIEILVPDVHNRIDGDLIDVTGLIAAAEFDSHERATALLAELPRRVRGIEMSGATIQSTLGTMADDTAKLARCHDLTLALIDPLMLDKKRLAEDMIFGTGGPVMVLPEVIGAAWDVRHIAIAWDGSRAAARAIRDAMGLLEAANRVSLFTAGDDKRIDPRSIADITAFLGRHDVVVTHRDVPTGAVNVGAALQRAALEEGAGLLVMGAFGRSRVTEFVLGGATRTVLDDAVLPILMSH